MGKAGKYGGSGRGYWSEDSWQAPSGHAWKLWSGARKPGAKKDPTGQFPAYDTDWGESQVGIEVISEKTYAQPSTPTLVSVVQRSVNLARKAETTLSKLQKEYQTKSGRWQTYKAAMKAAFNREQAKHEKDLVRLRAEIVAATQAQEDAYKLVEQAALGHQSSTSMETEGIDVGNTAWDELVSAPAEPTATQLQREMQEILARQQAQRAAGAGARAPAGLPPEPATRRSDLNYNTASPHMGKPFPMQERVVTTPEGARPPATGEESGTAAAVARRPSRPRHPTEGAAPRVPVKTLPTDIPKPPVAAPSLEAKLNRRREELRADATAAMMAVAQQAHQEALAEAAMVGRPETTLSHPATHMLDDDDSEAEPPEGGDMQGLE